MSHDQQNQTQNKKKQLLDKRYELIQDIFTSTAYNRKRQRFFYFWDKCFVAIAIIASSSAVASIQHPAFSITLSLIVAITSAFSLVLNLSEKSNMHSDIARKYYQLLTKIYQYPNESLTGALMTKWQRSFFILETEEPPSLGALVTICQNELALAQGQPLYVAQLKWYQKLFAHLFDFNVSKNVEEMLDKLEKEKAKEKIEVKQIQKTPCPFE